MMYRSLGLLILAACDQGLGGVHAIGQADAENEVIVQLTGTATPPPPLRIPRSHLANDLPEASNGTVSAISVFLLVPEPPAWHSSAEHEFVEGYRAMRLTHVAEGIARRRRSSIDLAVARNGFALDPATGLNRVMIEELPGSERRYRYFNDSKEDEEYVHLDCIFFEDPAREDSCFMEIVAAPGIAISTHFKAAGLSDWRARDTDMREMVGRWLEKQARFLKDWPWWPLHDAAVLPIDESGPP
jgi:hypothetical protein